MVNLERFIGSRVQLFSSLGYMCPAPKGEGQHSVAGTLSSVEAAGIWLVAVDELDAMYEQHLWKLALEEEGADSLPNVVIAYFFPFIHIERILLSEEIGRPCVNLTFETLIGSSFFLFPRFFRTSDGGPAGFQLAALSAVTPSGLIVSGRPRDCRRGTEAGWEIERGMGDEMLERLEKKSDNPPHWFFPFPGIKYAMACVLADGPEA